jgi:hypothetical protein
MRFFEISSGIRLPVSQEEQEILDLALEGSLLESKLDERQGEVARLMVSRGLLVREETDDDAQLKANRAVDIWRF